MRAQFISTRGDGPEDFAYFRSFDDIDYLDKSNYLAHHRERPLVVRRGGAS
jgi:hypothetical protein